MNENCKKASALFDAALDGELSGEEKAFFEKHLSECESCRQDYEMHRIMLHALHTPIPEPEKSIHDAVMARLPRVTKRAKILRTLRAVGGAAVAAVLCFAVLRSPLLRNFADEKSECMPNAPDMMSGENTALKGEAGGEGTFTYSKDDDMENVVGSIDGNATPEAPSETLDGLEATLEKDDEASPVYEYENILILLKTEDKATVLIQNENDAYTKMMGYRLSDDTTLILYAENGEARFKIEDKTLILTESTIPEIKPKG